MMITKVVRKNNIEIAVVKSEELLITDVLSALDLFMTVKYETGSTNIVINKDIFFQPRESLAVDKLSSVLTA